MCCEFSRETNEGFRSNKLVMTLGTLLILYRLLGPSAAADILQLSSSLPLQSRGRARLLVGNDDVHIIARSDDELLDDFFHDQSTATSQAGKFVL